MITEEIREQLFLHQDTKYRDYQAKLLPTVDPATIIGVSTPQVRKIAKKMLLREDFRDFLRDLPHKYYDENQLHTLALSEIKDYESCMEAVNRFLPFVDNWATCDQLSPKVFKKHRPALLEKIKEWIPSDHTYTVRFALGMLMTHFLEEDFDPAYLQLAAAVHSTEYYVNMMLAWYFATALAKQYEAFVPFLEQNRLDIWVHNKTIQKAIESYRITPEQKTYLRRLKRSL